MPEDTPTGAYVSMPFHGRTVKGWVLGETDDLPPRISRVRRVLSTVPLFDERLLELYRWVSERYVVPLSTVIGRAHPPRIASEERKARELPDRPEIPSGHTRLLPRYPGGSELIEACKGGSGGFLVRPLPNHEAGTCLEAVRACVSGGRRAIVIVPEADPLPETARIVAEHFGDDALVFAGGERRERYAAWLDILAGRYSVVVGTRVLVFAPTPDVGLIWVNREAHPGHREERAPYHHTREVALARARIHGAVGALSALCPSSEAAAMASAGAIATVRPGRREERGAAPLVQTIRPDHQELGPRLVGMVKESDGAFLLVSLKGGGVARVCRRCGEPARCRRCAGAVVLRAGSPVCSLCEAPAECAACGSTAFGVDPRGADHVAERASRLTGRPARVVDGSGPPVAPGPGSILVGTPAAVKDFGSLRVGLVGILDPDRARRREGIAAGEQSLATWMEAAIWAGPRGAGGSVVVQTAEPADSAIQALVRWDPDHFHSRERTRRIEAGFPPGHPVFRVRGGPALEEGLRGLDPVTLLATPLADETVCLIALRPEELPAFRTWVLGHLDVVARVEAEPQL